MKKILIIGAGFLQSFLIKKAKEMGYYTLAIDKNPFSVGFKYSDEHCVVDIIDKESCLEYAQSKSIDGVITAATDYGVLSASFVASKMNLPGIDYEVARVIKNKYLVRRTLYKNNVDDILQYYEIGSENELENIIDLIRFPVMVKPCDGSGSKAAIRVDSKNDLKKACSNAIQASLIGKALIEDFIVGKEYGVESFVYKNEIYILGVMGKHMTSPPAYAELGHCIPTQLLDEEKIKGVVKKAIQALGINFGSVNMDILVTNDNKICIVDIGARMGGNLIGSHIIPLGKGIDYMGDLIRASIKEPITLKQSSQKHTVATRILALRSGKIKGLPDFEQIKQQCNVEIYHNLKVGDIIKQYHNNTDGCGYVVAIANDLSAAEAQVQEAKHIIDNRIIRV